MDLSSPEGASVNDGIEREAASIHYPTVDAHFWLKQVSRRRIGTFLSIDGALLRSAPKLFSAIADAAQWVLIQKGVKNVLHYLDDFILVERDHGSALRARRSLEEVFAPLGLPLAPEKLEGPSKCLKFLGILFDTERLQLPLPEDKRERLEEELKAAQGRRVLSKKELQSLTGLLQHATKVIRPFLHQLYALQSIGSTPWHKVRLNEVAYFGGAWWGRIFSSLGCGQYSSGLYNSIWVMGVWGILAPPWLSVKWPPQLEGTSIQVKEWWWRRPCGESTGEGRLSGSGLITERWWTL